MEVNDVIYMILIVNIAAILHYALLYVTHVDHIFIYDAI